MLTQRTIVRYLIARKKDSGVSSTCTIRKIASRPHKRSPMNTRDAWVVRHGTHSPLA